MRFGTGESKRVRILVQDWEDGKYIKSKMYTIAGFEYIDVCNIMETTLGDMANTAKIAVSK